MKGPGDLGGGTQDGVPGAEAEGTAVRDPRERGDGQRGDLNEAEERDLEERLREAEAELASLRAELASVQRSRELERLLRDAGALDLEMAATMAEALVAQRVAAGESGFGLTAAVGELARTKPFLFGAVSGSGSGAGAMSAAPTGGSELARAASEAKSSGDRRLLLRYLRLRRRG